MLSDAIMYKGFPPYMCLLLFFPVFIAFEGRVAIIKELCFVHAAFLKKGWANNDAKPENTILDLTVWMYLCMYVCVYVF